MKTKTTRAALAAAFILLPSYFILAQGPLTPPGAPAPTMKTLDQIEPRTAINSTNTPGDAYSLFKITQPGSYYLTTNITGVAAKHGIEIAASGVTLDLMGFELAGVASSLDGVNVSSLYNNVAVRNGSVCSWGGNGVYAAVARNGQYQDLRLYLNGGRGLFCGDGSAVVKCTARFNSLDGIYVKNGSTVSGCTAYGNTVDGIYANYGSTVSGCSAFDNTGDGIKVKDGSTVSGCTAYSNGDDGFDTDSTCTVSGCTASFNTDDGIVAGAGSTVSGCTAYGSAGDGIQVLSDCRVVDNNCKNNGSGLGDGAGIHATVNDNRIDSNNVTSNDRGIDVDGAGNLIIRNSASGNTTNWDVVAGNVILVVNATTAGAVLGSSGGVAPGSTDPNANFTY